MEENKNYNVFRNPAELNLSDKNKSKIWMYISFVLAAFLVTLVLFFLFVYNRNISTPNNQQSDTNEQAGQNNKDNDNSTNEDIDRDDESTTDNFTGDVFFVNPSLEPEGNSEIMVFPVKRATTRADVIAYFVEQFIAGPTEVESTQGYTRPGNQEPFADASDCEGADFQITSLENNIATLRFCRTVIGLGSFADGQFLTSLGKTITQFSNVKRVIILNKDNSCLFDQSGLDNCKPNGRMY